MASKSGGTIPGPQMIADANQAVALLDAMHHWQCSRINGGIKRYYEVTITHSGKRVRAQRRLFVDAVIAAFAKLRGEPTRCATYMRMAR